MKNLLILAGLLISPLSAFSQVGIGTTAPNSKSLLDLSGTTKGFLLPRMISSERTAFVPINSTNEIGMMVYQTDNPKGVYSYNGSGWNYHAPIEIGGANGNTLRWDGNKWANASNFFNSGSSIALGTTSPNFQFQIHSGTGPQFTRIQLTNFSSPNSGTGPLASDGLVLGVGAALNNGVAHLINQEEKALWFGTNAIERMRIDSAGNVGINQTFPTAKLDIKGSVKIGEHGSVLHSIIRADIEINPPMFEYMTEWSDTISIPNSIPNAAVFVSPASELEGIAVCYARVVSTGNVIVKLMNMGVSRDPEPFTIHVAVIQ